MDNDKFTVSFSTFFVTIGSPRVVSQGIRLPVITRDVITSTVVA